MQERVADGRRIASNGGFQAPVRRIPQRAIHGRSTSLVVAATKAVVRTRARARFSPADDAPLRHRDADPDCCSSGRVRNAPRRSGHRAAVRRLLRAAAAQAALQAWRGLDRGSEFERVAMPWREVEPFIRGVTLARWRVHTWEWQRAARGACVVPPAPA